MIDGRLYAITDGQGQTLIGLHRDKIKGLISTWAYDSRPDSGVSYRALLFPSPEQATSVALVVMDDVPLHGFPTIHVAGTLRPL